MDVILKTFDIHTKPEDIIDITNEINNCLKDSKLKDGIVNVFVAGSTGAITTIEFEPGLVNTDIPEFMEKIIPYNKDYAHHKTWGDHNGAGHLRSFLLKTSLTIPFSEEKLILGTWQQVVLVDFDTRSRMRECIVQVLGE